MSRWPSSSGTLLTLTSENPAAPRYLPKVPKFTSLLVEFTRLDETETVVLIWRAEEQRQGGQPTPRGHPGCEEQRTTSSMIRCRQGKARENAAHLDGGDLELLDEEPAEGPGAPAKPVDLVLVFMAELPQDVLRCLSRVLHDGPRLVACVLVAAKRWLQQQQQQEL